MHFSIYVGRHGKDPVLLYDSYIIDDSSYQLTNILLRMNNEGGELSFTFPKTHYLWNSDYNSKESPLFTRRTDYVIVYKDDKWLWEGFLYDYNENINGDYDVVIAGALQYFKNVFCSLSTPINLNANGDNDIYSPYGRSGNRLWEAYTHTYPYPTHFVQYCIFVYMNRIVAQYNNRLNDLASVYASEHINFDYQKIYVHPTKSIIDVSDLNIRGRFLRITNFESCYDALEQGILDSLGGRFYITKEEIELLDACSIRTYTNSSSDMLPTQDDTIHSEKNRYVLLLNYTNKPKEYTEHQISLGKDLLEYNVNEDFELYTSVIPLGDSYNEDAPTSRAPGTSKWWFKDTHSQYNNVDQRASLGWRSYFWKKNTDGSVAMYPDGGSRYLLAESTRYTAGDIVKKYGFKECVLDLSDIAAKYPNPIDPATGELFWPIDKAPYGVPYGTDGDTWEDGRDYSSGDYIWVKKEGMVSGTYNHFLYCCIRDHKANANNCPKPDSMGAESDTYWDELDTHEHIKADPELEKAYGFVIAWKKYNAGKGRGAVGTRGWDSLSDYYLTNATWYPEDNPMLCEHAYMQDYMAAFSIIAKDFLENQQFNTLILEISVSLVLYDNILSLLGNKVPVSADLFGNNVKMFEVSEIELNISNINSSTIRIGGEQVNFTSLLRVKQK